MSVPRLHLPYKEWAKGPRNYAHYRENLRAIERWATSIACEDGDSPPPVT